MKPDKAPRKQPGHHSKGITRRTFIHLAQCTGLGALFGWNPAFGQTMPHGPRVNKPYTLRFPGRVAHVHDTDATSWNFSTGWYGDYVDQTVVDNMVDAGLRKLTNARTVASAWKSLVPAYVPGQTFAIKVNLNNFSATGPDPDPDINALIEPVNALIRTLIDFGVPARDISVFDVTNGWHSGAMPVNSFMNRCLYPGVNFVYHYQNPNPFSSTQSVDFNAPGSPGMPDLAIANVVVDSDYLINMFLPKGHGLAGVTLGFKNHMGSVDACQYMHDYLPYSYYYKPYYSTLVEIFRNPNFGPKTVLTMGDGLFGNWKGVNGKPLKWTTFGNDAPNSLFFSADPVSIDAVATDYIDKERAAQGYGGVISGTRDFLSIADGEGMGIFEQADPWTLPIGSDYKRITYLYVDGV